MFRDFLLSTVSGLLVLSIAFFDGQIRRDMIKQYMVKRIQRRFISNSRKAREKKDAKSKIH